MQKTVVCMKCHRVFEVIGRRGNARAYGLDSRTRTRRSRTAKGLRTFPLNQAAWDTILELRERAKLLFGDNLSMDWYVFPYAEGYQQPDPTRPMKGWRSAWRRITKSAGLQDR